LGYKGGSRSVVSCRGSTIIDLEVKAKSGISITALVDTGFFGDVLIRPEIAEGIGVNLEYERNRRLPDGRVVKVRYGVGLIKMMDSVTGGDVETWNELKLPNGVDALIGVTALEKLGFKVNPRTGELEKIELYLL
jgi:clan AA aspartic protease